MSDLKEFLYVLRTTRLEMLTEGPTEEESRVVVEHFQHLERLTHKGVVVLMGRTLNNDEDTIGLVIFRAKSDGEAQKIMESDPAVKQGLMSAKLYPYRIALMAKS